MLRFIRRFWLKRRPFPTEWIEVLQSRIPFYRQLPDTQKEKLHQRLQVFLDEKIFEGCGGLEMTKEKRIIIAAHACLLILEETSDYYPNLKSVLVYPKDYVAPIKDVDAAGVVTDGWESRSGESWNPGNVVLSWSDIRHDLQHPDDGKNLIYHEFAHQLDFRYGLSAGIDEEGETDSEDAWTRNLARVYREVRRKAKRGTRGLLDPYGALNPAECFAVITECFLEKPRALRKQYPDLYDPLVSFFGFDPSSFNATSVE